MKLNSGKQPSKTGPNVLKNAKNYKNYRELKNWADIDSYSTDQWIMSSMQTEL